MDCNNLIDICLETILDNIPYSDALEIHGVVEKNGICEQTQNGEPFDFFFTVSSFKGRQCNLYW